MFIYRFFGMSSTPAYIKQEGTFLVESFPHTTQSSIRMSTDPATVLWIDGCYDGFHYGHTNLIRQARAAIPGPVRVLAGIHSDREIYRNKGPTLFDEQERYALVAGCRFIDSVVLDVPYSSAKQRFIEKYRVDFVVHGDDPVQDLDGRDLYAEVKSLGKYLECKRTEGISTTSLIQRVLQPIVPRTDEQQLWKLLRCFAESVTPSITVIDFAAPGPHEMHKPESAAVVYVGGSWDCFGAAHVEYLRRSKEAALEINKNSILVIGIWSDEIVKEATGERPLLVLLERALAVVQCRYSDVLVLGTPDTVTSTLCDALGITAVVNGSHGAIRNRVKDIGVSIPPLQTVSDIRKKVLGYKDAYEERQRRKMAQELKTHQTLEIEYER